MMNKLITAIMLTISVVLMADAGVQSQTTLNVVHQPYQTALQFVHRVGNTNQNQP